MAPSSSDEEREVGVSVPEPAVAAIGAANGPLVGPGAIDGHVQEFEARLIFFLRQHGLPTDGLFVPVDERLRVLRNAYQVIAPLDERMRLDAAYIAKFLAAVTNGLFDAALNYLWDETVSQLRRRIVLYDLAYFYDNAITNPTERRRFQSEDDLPGLGDQDLLRGALTIGLLDDLGFSELDLIRHHRNWASAAHPNQHDLRGFQLLDWLEVCTTRVIARPLPTGAVTIQRLLGNVRRNTLTPSDARVASGAFADLTQEQSNRLCFGLFGIFTDPAAAAQARTNVTLLLPALWARVDEPTRSTFGVRYGRYATGGDLDQQRRAREFLEIVDGQAYFPEGIRAAEIDAALESLEQAHANLNNFYTEPPLARDLERLIGTLGAVPANVAQRYVRTLVALFLTNGHGVAVHADPVYGGLIGTFTREQAVLALVSFTDPTIATKRRVPLGQRQFRAMLTLLAGTLPTAAQQLVALINDFSGPLEQLAADIRVRRVVNHLTRLAA